MGSSDVISFLHRKISRIGNSPVLFFAYALFHDYIKF